MSETGAPPQRGADTPGALLRAARERQGLELAALAAATKVRPDKLAALEGDRYEQLPDVAFTRALARTLCRALKIDEGPVLAGLPASPDAARLEQVATGLNTPFRDRPGREARDWSPLKRPVLWAVGLLVLAAVALLLAPAQWLQLSLRRAASVETAAGPASAPSAVVETVFAAPGVETEAVPASGAASGTPAPEPAAAASLLVLRASAESWVEVRDGAGQVLLSRALQAGETVNLDGTLPLRATIGNASAMRASFRGQPLDLSARARDNVARLELK